MFDHFARVMQRPQSGGHYLGDDGIVRSDEDSFASHDPVVTIQNGVTKYPTDVSFGGRPLNNSLANNMGEYDSEYTVRAGSYYEKAFAAMLLTESVDNFISSSRNDFLDARFRNISMADVFPDGFRRWLGTNLTGDEMLKGPRLAADADGRPLTVIRRGRWAGRAGGPRRGRRRASRTRRCSRAATRRRTRWWWTRRWAGSSRSSSSR